MKIIMIVDDDSAGQRLLSYRLKISFNSLPERDKAMPEIIQAEDAKHAWELLTRESINPDMMVIDYKMPGMNGLDLVATIKANLPQLKPEIVLFTDYLPIEEEATKRWGCHFIPKGIGGKGEKEIFRLAAEKGLFTP